MPHGSRSSTNTNGLLRFIVQASLGHLQRLAKDRRRRPLRCGQFV